mgnify:CR=1 FL=1
MALPVRHAGPGHISQQYQMQQAVQRPVSDITSAQPQQHRNRRVHHGVQIQRQPARAQHQRAHVFAKSDMAGTAQRVQAVPAERIKQQQQIPHAQAVVRAITVRVARTGRLAAR